MNPNIKRRLILWCCIIGICVFSFLLWIYPRSLETLVGIPLEKVTFWGVESTSGCTDGQAISSFDSNADADDLNDMYGLAFSRPVLCSALEYDTKYASYSLFFSQEEQQQKRFLLLEDGTLWDGTWRYSLAGGESALTMLREWLAAAFD